MHLDKTQYAAFSAMIETTYRPVIKRTLANMVLMDISSIAAIYRTQHSNMSVNESMQILLPLEWVQKELLKRLDFTHAHKGPDAVEEILKQYGLTGIKEEIDLYHKHMELIYKDELGKIRNLVMIKNYEKIHQISREAYVN